MFLKAEREIHVAFIKGYKLKEIRHNSKVRKVFATLIL